MCFALAVMVGLQAGVLLHHARWLGITEGLLPDDPFIRKLIEPPRRLEWTLVVGMSLVVVGLGLSIYALVKWNEADFGPLNYADTLRIVIPGATLIACGIQTVLTTLFLGVLGLRGGGRARRRSDPSRLTSSTRVSAPSAPGGWPGALGARPLRRLALRGLIPFTAAFAFPRGLPRHRPTRRRRAGTT